MGEEQQRTAKGRMVALMQAGYSWQEAATQAGVQTSRSAAYRQGVRQSAFCFCRVGRGASFEHKSGSEPFAELHN